MGREDEVLGIIVTTLTRRGTILKVNGDFGLPVRGSNEGAIARTGIALRRMADSGHR